MSAEYWETSRFALRNLSEPVPWEWAPFAADGVSNGEQPLFAGAISPTDIDGAAERNGHFLFIEFKDWAGPSRLPAGQQRFYRELCAARPDLFTFVLVCGDRGSRGVRAFVVAPSTSLDTSEWPEGWQVMDDPAEGARRFRAFLNEWWRQVEAIGRVVAA